MSCMALPQGSPSGAHRTSQEGNLAESDVAPAESAAVERTADSLAHKEQVRRPWQALETHHPNIATP